MPNSNTGSNIFSQATEVVNRCLVLRQLRLTVKSIFFFMTFGLRLGLVLAGEANVARNLRLAQCVISVSKSQH